jgi:hypothetical protein
LSSVTPPRRRRPETSSSKFVSDAILTVFLPRMRLVRNVSITILTTQVPSEEGI